MNTKLLRILGKRGRITIPYEIRQRVGFAYNDVLSFTESADGRSVIVRREKLCDNCQSKTVQPVADDRAMLLELLDSLPLELQKAAFVQLRMPGGEVLISLRGSLPRLSESCTKAAFFSSVGRASNSSSSIVMSSVIACTVLPWQSSQSFSRRTITDLPSLDSVKDSTSL